MEARLHLADRVRPAGDHLDLLAREAGVLEAQGQIVRAQAGDDGVFDRRDERLEVRVPDPGDVAAVGDAVVECDPEVDPAALAALQQHRPQHLVGAGGVLDQQDRDRRAADRDRLDPPEGGFHPAQRGGDPLRRDPQPQPGGDPALRVAALRPLDFPLDLDSRERGVPETAVQILADSGYTTEE